MEMIVIVIGLLGVAALATSSEARVDTHTFLFRAFVVCALVLLLIMLVMVTSLAMATQ